MKIFTIGKRSVPLAQFAYVEPADLGSNTKVKSDKEVKSRAVLTNRDTVLTEMSPLQFAEDHGMKILTEDQLALNSDHVVFRVETFEPTEKFQAGTVSVASELASPGGAEHSRLLLMEPAVLATMAANQSADYELSSNRLPQRPARGRRMVKEPGAARTQ